GGLGVGGGRGGGGFGGGGEVRAGLDRGGQRAGEPVRRRPAGVLVLPDQDVLPGGAVGGLELLGVALVVLADVVGADPLQLRLDEELQVLLLDELAVPLAAAGLPRGAHGLPPGAVIPAPLLRGTGLGVCAAP